MSRLIVVPGNGAVKPGAPLVHLGAEVLAGLYRLRPGSFMVWDVIDMPAFRPAPTDVLLYASHTGDYTLPAAAKELLK